jgi:YVTN family beta-propeller protein
VLKHVAAALGLGAIMAAGLTGAALAGSDVRGSEIVATIPVGADPQEAALTPDGSTLYVTNRRDGTVSVIDTQDNRAIETIEVGYSPRALAMAPDGTALYIGSDLSPEITVIDTVTRSVKRKIPTAAPAFELAISKDSRHLYAALPTLGFLAVIDTASGATDATVPVGLRPTDVTVSPRGDQVYVVSDECKPYDYPCFTPGKATIIDSSTFDIQQTLETPLSPRSVVVAPDAKRWYVNHLNGIEVYTSPANTFVTRIKRASWGDMAFAPDGSTLYANRFGSASVVAINPETNLVFETIRVPRRPWGLAINSAGERLYIVSQVSEPGLNPDPGVVTVLTPAVKPPPPPTITASCRARALNGIRAVTCSGVTTDIAQGARLTAHTRTPPSRDWKAIDSRQGAVVEASGTFTWSLAVPKQRTVAVYFSFGDVASEPVKVKLW